MQGPEFRPSPSNIAGSNVRDSQAVDRRSAERQSKLDDLKARVQSGAYRVDTSALAQTIRDSGVFGND